MIENIMKKDIGKEFFWDDKRVKIINGFSCYEGDFYEYTVNGSEETFRVNINTENGYSFVRCIPE